MKKILSIFIVSIFYFSVYAQIDSKIIGTWKVTNVESTKSLKLNNKEQKQFEQLKKADIIFTADHHAKIKLFLSGFNVSDGYWYYNKDKDVIIITKWDNQKEDLMRFWYDELDNGDLKLYMDETPYAIYVTRKVEK